MIKSMMASILRVKEKFDDTAMAIDREYEKIEETLESKKKDDDVQEVVTSKPERMTVLKEKSA